MANFTVTGFDDVEKELLKQSDKATRLIPKMLEAGAAKVVEAQKAEIDTMINQSKVRKSETDTRSLGDLKKSIKASRVTGNSVSSNIEVYPQGKDSKGQSNATKGFVLEYGKTTAPAYPWMTIANEKSSQEVHETMKRIWEEE